MPLPPASEREHLHTRRVTCEGFRWKDGFWDIKAHLLDTKRYGFENRDRGGWIAAGEAVHDMRLRIKLDLDFNILAVVASTDETPFNVCKQAAAGIQDLVGLKIGPGWMREVRA